MGRLRLCEEKEGWTYGRQKRAALWFGLTMKPQNELELRLLRTAATASAFERLRTYVAGTALWLDRCSFIPSWPEEA